MIHTSFNHNTRFIPVTGTNSNVADGSGDATYFVDYIIIDGVRYALYNVTYKEILTPEEVSRPSLLQVFLDQKADNEDVALFGNTWEILVVSQAVQATGFASAQEALNEAFGVVSATSHPWIDWDDPEDEHDQEPDSVRPADATELKEALNNGGVIYLLPNTEYDLAGVKLDNEKAVINGYEGSILKNVAPGEIAATLNGVTITKDVAMADGEKYNIQPNAVLENVTFKGIVAVNNDSSSDYVDGGVFNIDAGAVVKNLVIEDCDITGSGGRSAMIGCSEPSAEITVKNSKLAGTKYLIYASKPIAAATIEGCEINNISSWAVLMNAGDTVGAKLTINKNTFTNCPDGIAKYLGGTQAEGAATVFTNNTLINCRAHDGVESKWFTIPGATSTITVSGNTLDGVAWTPGTAQGLGK